MEQLSPNENTSENDRSRIQHILESYEQGFLKKLFAVPHKDSIFEMYIDTRTRDMIGLQWTAVQEAPQCFIAISDTDYTRVWNDYKSQGSFLRSCQSWKKEIEQAKGRAVQSLEMGAEEKFAIRLYEVMKFVCKDRRLKGGR